MCCFFNLFVRRKKVRIVSSENLFLYKLTYSLQTSFFPVYFVYCSFNLSDEQSRTVIESSHLEILFGFQPGLRKAFIVKRKL